MIDLAIPIDDRVAMLASAIRTPGDDEQLVQILRYLIHQAERAHAHSLHLAKAKELTEILIQLQSGPCRPAVFLGMATPLPSRHTENGAGIPRALVALEDGTRVYVAVPNQPEPDGLHPGTPTIVDAHATALLGIDRPQNDDRQLTTGEIGVFERRTGTRTIEVSVHGGQQRLSLLVTPSVHSQLCAGQITLGASVALNSRQLVAHHPIQDASIHHAHMKFLHRGPTPCVRVEDLACPHPVIEAIDRHIAVELGKPEVHRRYGLGSSLFRLLVGPSGTGKSVAIRTIHHRLRQRCAHALGVEVGAVPSRAFFLRGDQLVSKWLGDSEKAFARAVDEVLELAAAPVKDAHDNPRLLPVLMVLEEVEAIGRVRGGEHEAPAMDRIMGTILQLLDPGRPEFQSVTVICLATTNTPDLVDPAFARRIGARIEVFTRLNRTAFRRTLSKQVERLPVAAENGTPAATLWSRHVENLAAWLWSPETKPVLELTLAGSSQPQTRYARDFLTPALLNQAVEEAGREAVRSELDGTHSGGITFDALARALDSQILNVVGAVREGNAALYCDVLQGSRVAAIRRLPGTARTPTDLIATPA